MLCEELEKIKNHQKNIKKFNSYLKKKYRQKLIFSFFKLVFYFYNLSIKLIYKSKWIAKKLFIFFNKLIKKCKRKIINFFVLANYRRKKKRKFLIYINSIDDTEKKPKFYFIISNLKLFLFKYELKFFEENKHVSFKYLYYFIKVFCHNFFNYTMRFTLYFRFKNFCKFCSFLLYRNKVICYLIGKFKKKLKNNPLKLIRLSIVYNLNNKFFKRKKFDLTRLRRRFKRGNKNVWYRYRISALDHVRKLNGFKKKRRWRKLFKLNSLNFKCYRVMSKKYLFKHAKFKPLYLKRLVLTTRLKYFYYRYFKRNKKKLKKKIFNNFLFMRIKRKKRKERKMEKQKIKDIEKEKLRKIIKQKQTAKEKALEKEKELYNKSREHFNWIWKKTKHLFYNYKYKNKKAPYHRKLNAPNRSFNRFWLKWNKVRQKSIPKRFRRYYFRGQFKRYKAKLKIKRKICLRILFSRYFRMTYNRLQKYNFFFTNLKYFINFFYNRLELVLIRLNIVGSLLLSRFLILNRYVFINNFLCTDLNYKVSKYDIIEMVKGFDLNLFVHLNKFKSDRIKKRRRYLKNYKKCVLRLYSFGYINKYYSKKFKLNYFKDSKKVSNIWLSVTNFHSFDNNKIINRRILNYYVNYGSFYT